MEIRKFKKEDARKVSNLIRKCFREVNSKDYPKKVIDFMCSHFSPKKIIVNSAKRQIFVAVEKDKIIGTVSIHDNIILTVFVNPKIHGKGIGKKLMTKVESEAKKNGFKSVKLPSSITAIDFYKKLGYKKVKVMYELNFGKTIEMRKIL
ncbi:MAG: GNAT family N-acetyltransferase [Nanoarchaeota archaeon]|nr:GNAT family N-acetyltransferase [Nanoarchaeota archaeon]